MHPDTREMATHMKQFGLSILGRAIYDATFAEIMKPFSHALAVVHAAHGAEIVLKARIAQEHPLLVFDRLPPQTSTAGILTGEQLFDHGKTVAYSDLPNLLWASTGHRLTKTAEYQQFGELRNKIVHFAVPEIDLSKAALKFCIEVIEPVLEDFWKESAIPYAETWDPEIVVDGYLEKCLMDNGVQISTSVRQRLQRTN